MGGLTYGSLCSGIEAATVAWHPLGWTPAFFSEIDKSASRLLAHHYPRVPNHGDMTKFKEWPDHAIQLLVGGTPCQSFSVAGLRKGLADPRGNLALTFLAVADHYRPAWVVWENVPGVFSSVSHDAPDPRPPPDNLDSGDGPADGQEVVVEDEYDADENTALGCFLAGLSELGYGCAWAIRDAQHVRVDGFGRAVPQRRRRVFVVGHLGDWRRAAAVLFERESLSGHSPPRREKGKGTAADVDPSLTSSGRGVERTGETRGQDPVIGVMCADVSMCLNAGGMGRIDSESESESESESFIAHALTSSGFDASENGTGRRTPLVPVAYRTTGNDGCYETGDIIHALNTATDQNQHVLAIRGAASRENPDSGPDGIGVREDGASYTLEARSEVQAVAFDMRGREGGAQFEGPHYTANIRAANGGSSRSYVAQQWAVRRLTPRECERLQGFPDDYTLLADSGKPQADGPRYKQLGNSMAVNVMRWIGRRIQMVNDAPPPHTQENR